MHSSQHFLAKGILLSSENNNWSVHDKLRQNTNNSIGRVDVNHSAVARHNLKVSTHSIEIITIKKSCYVVSLANYYRKYIIIFPPLNGKF